MRLRQKSKLGGTTQCLSIWGRGNKGGSVCTSKSTHNWMCVLGLGCAHDSMAVWVSQHQPVSCCLTKVVSLGLGVHLLLQPLGEGLQLDLHCCGVTGLRDRGLANRAARLWGTRSALDVPTSGNLGVLLAQNAGGSRRALGSGLSRLSGCR